MLTILIGRAGTGKSRRVLESIRTRRTQRPQILLVPEHISYEAEMDLCRVCGDTASRDAEALSFHNLATRVLSQTGGLADFTLDNGGKILTLRRCLQELAPQLRVFGRPSQRAAFLQQMMALFDEFAAYEVAPETLLAGVEDMPGAAGDKLRDVALLYGAYDARLHTADFDARSRMQKLRQALERSDYLKGKDLYLDGFSFFNRLEESILAQALRQSASVTVTLLGDRGRDDLFRNAVMQRDRLIRMARQEGVVCRVEHISENRGGPMGHLERCFFGADETWEGAEEAIALYEAGNTFSEVEYVSAGIRRLVQKGFRYREIGVAARHMEDYGPLIERIFRRDGIPAYVSRRSDVLEKPMLTMLLSAVDAATGGFEYEDMFRCLKTGMAGITPEECDLLENYVIRWQIRGSMWVRHALWTANPDGYGMEMTPQRQAVLERINEIRDKVCGPLSTLHEGLKTFASAREKASVLYRFAEAVDMPARLQKTAEALLADHQAQLAAEYRQLWEVFCSVLDQFVEILGDTPLEGQEFARLLRLVLTQYSVGTIPATLDQVKVSEITRNDRHSVKVLFLLGANDHILPSADRERGILDDEDRAALLQRDIPLSGATFDGLDNELQNIYACLAQPTEQLHVSWCAADVGGAQLRPSFVVERLEKLFPAARRRREDGAYRMELPAAALAVAGSDPGGDAWRYFTRRPEYAPVCAAIENARALRRGRLSPEAVRVLYGSRLSMSASRVDKVRSCHFAYFLQYGLRARERKASAFDAPEIGTFIHYLLENVTREVMDRGGYGAVPREALRSLVEDYVSRYADTQIDGYQQKSARFRYLFSRLRKTAWTVIEDIAEELSQSDFVPVAFELGFGGRDGRLPEITVREGETRMAVTGKVDRVDGWLKDGRLYLRVVDYKTGAKSFRLSDIRYGLGIQMLLYLFTLQKEGESYFGHPVVPCGVLYHPARDLILPMDRNTPPEQVEAELRKKLRRSGVVLGEPEVLQAMEHSALESPDYLPVTVRKGGQLSGGIATAAQLGRLSRYVDRLLHDIAREIGGGDIAADPCVRGQESACTYCPYGAACGFDETQDSRRYLQSTGSEEFWALIERESDEVTR